MKLLRSTLWLLLTLALGSPAAAQITGRPLPSARPVGIVFPSAVGRTTANTPEDDELAEKAIAEVEQALRWLGYEVLPRSEVIQKLVEAGINCRGGVHNCPSAEVLKALDLGAVVLVAIWWDRRPADITIEVTTADATGIAKGKLDDDVSKHVPELVTRALKDLDNGKAVEVRIYSVPIGAEVRLDGELLGTAPVITKARPGTHEVMLSYPEYVTTSRHFEVPRGADGPVPIDVTLERTTESAARAPVVPMPPPTRPSPAWDYALGAILAGAGVALAVNPARTLASSGECDPPPRGGSCTAAAFDTRSGLQLAGSAVALAGAIYTFVSLPISSSITANRDSVHVQITSSF